MIRFILKRLLTMGLSLFLISLLLFALIHCADSQFIPHNALSADSSKQVSLETKAANYRQAYGLDQAILPRFGSWITRCAVLDFGDSMTQPKSVMSLISLSVLKTLPLQILALMLIFGLGTPLGVLLAQKPGSLIDRFVGTLLNASYAMPTFWLASCLLVFLATHNGLELFPFEKLQSAHHHQLGFFGGWLDRLYHMILPAVALALPGMALVARQTRAAMIDSLNQDFIRTARAAGISERLIHWKYALRHAALPSVMIFGALIPGLVGGSIVVERIFNIHGVGYLLWDSVLERDFPVLQGLLFLTAAAVLIGYFTADLIALAIDPRLRPKKGHHQI